MRTSNSLGETSVAEQKAVLVGRTIIPELLSGTHDFGNPYEDY